MKTKLPSVENFVDRIRRRAKKQAASDRRAGLGTDAPDKIEVRLIPSTWMSHLGDLERPIEWYTFYKGPSRRMAAEVFRLVAGKLPADSYLLLLINGEPALGTSWQTFNYSCQPLGFDERATSSHHHG